MVALGLVITLLTPELGAPPANDTPVTCTEESLSEALRRFESTIKAQKAIIVVGAEGSGSKLAALAAVNQAEFTDAANMFAEEEALSRVTSSVRSEPDDDRRRAPSYDDFSSSGAAEAKA